MYDHVWHTRTSTSGNAHTLGDFDSQASVKMSMHCSSSLLTWMTSVEQDTMNTLRLSISVHSSTPLQSSSESGYNEILRKVHGKFYSNPWMSLKYLSKNKTQDANKHAQCIILTSFRVMQHRCERTTQCRRPLVLHSDVTAIAVTTERFQSLQCRTDRWRYAAGVTWGKLLNDAGGEEQQCR